MRRRLKIEELAKFVSDIPITSKILWSGQIFYHQKLDSSYLTSLPQVSELTSTEIKGSVLHIQITLSSLIQDMQM